MTPLRVSLAIGVTFGAALTFAVWMLASASPLRWHQQSLHAAVEALGGLCALVMGIVLVQRRAAPHEARTGPLATGFIAMGALEMFHAASPPGNAFVLTRHVASFMGALGFVQVWGGEVWARRLRRPAWPWLVAGTAIVIGMTITAASGALPEMIRNGRFAPVAAAPIALASMLFLAASVRFFLDARKDGRPEALLFGFLMLLFGLAEAMVTYSMPWDTAWWSWHGLRLLAYLMVLAYLLGGYRQMIGDLRASLAQTAHAEEAARRSEQGLRRALEDRERIAQDLHDGIIQSLFALRLSLERCQRLLTTEPAEVGRQLALGVDSIKAAIRDLRTHISGIEPHIVNGRELEAALAMQVRLLNPLGESRIELNVAPEAADHVAPHEAAHLLYVAHESVSNSLRHGHATRVRLSLDRHDGHVRLVVTDNGAGFLLADAPVGEGLKNMAARAAKLYARFTVVSEPGRGATVVFELPKEPLHA